LIYEGCAAGGKFENLYWYLDEPGYNADVADDAIAFFRGCLTHTKGRWAGQPFDLLPWQEHRIIRPLFGILREQPSEQYPRGIRRIRKVYCEIPKKNGKALALDTPIPTPDGWSYMGDIQVGDTVFDVHGEPTAVIAVTPVMTDRKCYRVTFADGCEVVCDAEHEWVTYTYAPWMKYTSHTTEEIRNTLAYQNGRNHKVLVAPAIQAPEKEFSVHPYVLGVWLGDGNSHNASITCAYSDGQLLEELNKVGVETYEWESTNDNTGQFHLGKRDRSQAARNGSIQTKLRDMGLLKNKHIPDIYLRGSIEQRYELLRGLMDTDGYISKAGQCEFTTTLESLRDGFMELAISLGLKPTTKMGRATLNGNDCGPKYRIMFFAYKDTPIFKLARKLERQKEKPSKPTRTSYRKIVAVESVSSEPVKCIQIASPTKQYLCGRSMIPTHNSELVAGVGNKLVRADGEVGAEVYSAAGDKDQASIIHNVSAQMFRNNQIMMEDIQIKDSIKRIIFHKNGSYYQALSADVPTKHGFNSHGILFDELHAQPNSALWDILTEGSTVARLQPVIFAVTTAGYDRESICWKVREYAMKVMKGIIEDPEFLPVIYGMDEDEDWDNEENWLKVNPSMDKIFSLEDFRKAHQEAKEMPYKENLFRRLRLNQWTRQDVRAIPMPVWDACGRVQVVRERLRGMPCYVGLDLSQKTDLTALARVFPVDDKIQVIWDFWVPAENVMQRVQRDKVKYDQWIREGWIRTTPGNVIDYSFIEKYIKDESKLYDFKEIGYDPWNAMQTALSLESAGFATVPVRQGYGSMSNPTKEFLALIAGGKLQHGGNPVARWAADNMVTVEDAAGNIKPDKAKSTERIDPIVAAIIALSSYIVNANKHRPSVYLERGLMAV